MTSAERRARVGRLLLDTTRTVYEDFYPTRLQGAARNEFINELIAAARSEIDKTDYPEIVDRMTDEQIAESFERRLRTRLAKDLPS